MIPDSKRPESAFEERVIAPRFLVGELQEDSTESPSLVVYIYACKADYCYGGLWAYFVRGVDMTVGVEPGGPGIAGVFHCSRPLLHKPSVAEEYERVSGFPLEVSELVTT